MNRPTRPSGPIHLADLVTALADLPWRDASEAQAIAGCLGFGLAAPRMQVPKATEAISDPRLDDHGATAEAPEPLPVVVPPAPPVPVGLPERIVDARLSPLLPPPPPSDRPDWLDQDYQIYRSQPGSRLARHALIPDSLARGIYTAALATQHPGRELDMPALIGQIACGRLPQRLPRLPASTLARGCQLLLDFSDSMMPWWEDLHDLARQVRQVVGENTVEIHEFRGNPNDARPWLSEDEERPWRPNPQKPILLATDFAIRGQRPPRSPAAWQDFVSHCARRGSPLVILVPWRRQYWPNDLGPHPDFMHWHPRTSAAMVRRKLGRGGHKVRP